MSFTSLTDNLKILAAVIAVSFVLIGGNIAVGYITNTAPVADAAGSGSCSSCGSSVNWIDPFGGLGQSWGVNLDGGGGGGGGITPTPVPPACTLTANSSQITQGQVVLLSWTSVNATALSIDNGIGAGVPVLAGFTVAMPSQTTLYTATVTGAGGTATCTAAVTVVAPPQPPICTLDLTKDKITWTTNYGFQVLITPLTNSPQVPGMVGGTMSGAIVHHTEADAYNNPAVISDLAANGISLPAVQWNTGFFPDQTTMDRVCSRIDGAGAVASNIGIGKYNSPSNNAVVQYASGSWTQIIGYHKFHLSGSFDCTLPGTPSSYPLNGSYTFIPPLGVGTHTYHLVVNGIGGTNTCDATVVVPPPTPKPTCTLHITPNSCQASSQASIVWTTTDATSFTIDHGIGAVTPVAGGSKNINPTYTTTYTGTATGPGGTVTCSDTITVTPPPPPNAPTCTLTSTPNTCSYNNKNATLAWTTTNATSVVIDNGVGSVTPVPSGTKNVTPASTTTYTATVTGPGGSVHCSTTVTIQQPPDAPSCTLTADDSTIVQGNATKLRWTSTNGTSIVIDNGVGAVTPVASGMKSVTPSATTLYKATVTGPGGTANCTTKITVTTPVPPPTCKLKVSKGICSYNESLALSWETTNATAFSINQGIGSVTPVPAGSTTINPTTTTVYTGIATGPGGTATCDTTVSVLPPPPPKVPSCTLGASNTNITEGDTTTLSWVSYNVSSGTIDHAVGAVTPVAAGSVDVSPTTTTTYVASFTGSYGAAQCSVKIKVMPKVYAPTCTLALSKTNINQGETASLSWTTTNSNTITVDQGIGSVTPVAAGSKQVTPSANTTYTATATGPGGTVTCSKKIYVTPIPSAPTCSMNISPTSLNAPGTATVSWTTSNVTSGAIDQGVGSVAANGNATVTADVSKTYTGTFSGPGGTVTCSTAITVTPPPNPVCTLSVSKSEINPGESIKITWSSTNANTGFISNVGTTTAVSGGTTDDIFPSDSTTYVGTFKNATQTVTCEVPVKVIKHTSCTSGCGGGGIDQPTVVLFQKPVAAPLAFVSLQQIPYTGFEAGPTLTFLFWMAVALLALIGTYAAMGRGGLSLILGGALQMAGQSRYVPTYDSRTVPADNEYQRVDSAAYSANGTVLADVADVPAPQHAPTKGAQDGIPDLADVIEARANGAGVLMSPEAVQMALALSGDRAEALRMFGEILNEAVKTIPREDGWILLTSERFDELRGEAAPVVTMATPTMTPSIEHILAGTMTEPIGHVVAKSSNVEMPMNAGGDQAAMDLITAILDSNRDKAYHVAHLLEVSGANVSSVMTVIATALDQLYRARRHGTETPLTLHASRMSESAIQSLVEVFAHGMDHGYTNQYTALKLAIAQAFEARG